MDSSFVFTHTDCALGAQAKTKHSGMDVGIRMPVNEVNGNTSNEKIVEWRAKLCYILMAARTHTHTFAHNPGKEFNLKAINQYYMFCV